MVEVAGGRHRGGQEGSERIPDLRGEIRPLIPKLGLRNYWYPAIPKRRILSRRQVKVSLMGEDLCFFKGDKGQAVAIIDICPTGAPAAWRAPATTRELSHVLPRLDVQRTGQERGGV